jgi:hypothetical protein
MKKFNLKLFSEIGSKDSMRRGTTTPTRSSIRPTKNVQSTFQKNSGTLTITGNYYLPTKKCAIDIPKEFRDFDNYR